MLLVYDGNNIKHLSYRVFSKVTEKGEECDCGYSNEECKESCCYPKTDPNGRGCTLKGEMECRLFILN